MLIGQDDLIKPDRMVLRWFKHHHHHHHLDPNGARRLITALVPVVSERLKGTFTAWEIGHAMWNSARG